MKIRFVIGQTSVTATLDDSGSTRGFASLLPLELERFYRQDGRSLVAAWDDPPRIDDSGVDAFAGSSSVRALISGSAEGD